MTGIAAPRQTRALADSIGVRIMLLALVLVIDAGALVGAWPEGSLAGWLWAAVIALAGGLLAWELADRRRVPERPRPE